MEGAADIYKGTRLRRSGLPWNGFPNQKREPLWWEWIGLWRSAILCYFLRDIQNLILRKGRFPWSQGCCTTGNPWGQASQDWCTAAWQERNSLLLEDSSSSLIPVWMGSVTGDAPRCWKGNRHDLQRILREWLLSKTLLSQKPHLCAEGEHAPWDVGCRLQSSLPGLGNLRFLPSAFYKGLESVAETHIFCDCKVTKVEVNHRLMGRHKGTGKK